jgi:EamA domain-containing membrane protein RarD
VLVTLSVDLHLTKVKKISKYNVLIEKSVWSLATAIVSLKFQRKIDNQKDVLKFTNAITIDPCQYLNRDTCQYFS